MKKKQEASNEVRLKSLKHKHEQYNYSKLIVQESLQNPRNIKNQHIFFDDEDEDSCPVKKTKISASAFSMPNGTNVQKSEKKNSHSKKKRKKDALSDNFVNKKILKNNSTLTDPLNIENETENISLIAPTTISKKSNEKLQALQEKVGNDGRFKIDKRFVDNGDNDKTCDANSEIKTKSDEVKANLALFHQVMGPLTVSNVGKQSVHFSDPSTRRYDPSLEDDNESYFINDVDSIEPKEKKLKKNVPKVSKKQFYDVSETDLKQAFSKTKPAQLENDSDMKPFSLLNMLGRDKEEEEETLLNDVSNYRSENLDKLNEIVSKLHSSKIFEYDSSDESADDDNKLEQIKSCKVEKSSASEDQERFFLLCKTDSKFDIAQKLSNRHKYSQDWSEIRADVITECKNWHRNASMWSKTQKKKNNA